jgi:hypothetical protein
VAEGRVVHSQVVADLSDHDLSGVEAHPYGEVESLLESQLVCVTAKILLESERGVAGALRVVLVRDRSPEQRHDPIAGELVHRPLEAVDAVGEDLKEAVHDPIPLLRIDLLAEVHRAFQIREEHGHVLALSLDGASRREDLLSEVLRRIGEWIWWWPRFRGLSELLSAFSAELLAWLVLRFAGRADERELGAALGPKPSAGSILPAAL